MSKVAYLGPEGTFSGILARQRFGKKADLLPCPTIDAIFDSVLSGAAPMGLVPVENSSGGTVPDTIDLLIRHASSIFIHEELSLNIRIALLGRAGSKVKTVYSHFTQIKHHGDWLKSRYPKATLVPVQSTAIASELASSKPHSAALASPGAAEIYHLDVLEFPSGTDEVNVTNFFTIGRKDQTIASLAGAAGFDSIDPISTHEFIGVSDIVGHIDPATEDVDLPRFLRHIKCKPRLVVGISRQSGEILGGGIRDRSALHAIHPAGIQKQRALHQKGSRQRIHLGHEVACGIELLGICDAGTDMVGERVRCNVI